jgi:integrase
MGRKPSRPEQGTITQKHGAWYWRHYAVDETGQRKQVWVKLCDVSDEHRGKADVLPLVRDRIKQELPGRPRGNRVIADYATEEFLPWIKVNRSPATYHGYLKLWNKHLAPHFGKMRMFDYTSLNASRFLNALAPTMTRTSLSHVRALMSAIFSHAHDCYAVPNPLRDVKLLKAKPKASKGTPHYTPAEIIAALHALEDEPMAQIVLALAFFAGLMPSEILGLQWADIASDYSSLTVRRAIWNGQVTEGKNEHRKAPVAIIEPLRGMLRVYKATTKILAESQHVITNTLLQPQYSTHNLQHRIMQPAFERAGIEWKPLYAGRRGLGTILYQKSPQAAQATLRHKDLRTTEQFYVKRIDSVTQNAMTAIEGEVRQLREQETNERQLSEGKALSD